MAIDTTKVNLKFQVVIPKAVRSAVNIAPEERLIVQNDGNDTIILRKLPKSIMDIKGSHKFPKDYLTKERISW